MPQNIERLMELLGYSASSGRISDPVPPTNGTARFFLKFNEKSLKFATKDKTYHFESFISEKLP